LLRRVPEGVTDAVAAAIQHPDGGKRLAEAWATIFGLNPNPSYAYALAIKAVEDAAIPVVCPKKKDAILGDVIGDLDNNPRWHLPHKREHTNAPAREVLVSMLRMIYRGQHDRHGGMPVVRSDMGQAEAESAVMLAVTLVGWYGTGKVQR